MKILKKSCIIIFFLFIATTIKCQIFSLTDSIPTKISQIKYGLLPIQSENDFNFLLYSDKEKQNFKLMTIKGTSIRKTTIKNIGLDGDGGCYMSAAMSNEILLLLHVDGYLVVYEKNKKGKFIFEKTLNVGTGNYSTISLLDKEHVLLANTYNYYTEKKLYHDYALSVLNLRTKDITHHLEMDLGKGILLSHFSSTKLIESKKNKIAVAHPTLPLIYIYNEKLEPIDTIHAPFQHAVSIDSVINAVFTDAFIKRNKTNPKEIMDAIDNRKIDQMERIEKVFWVNDDIVGYTICQPVSKWARIFVFYSISEKRELYKNTESYSDDSNAPFNFVTSRRVLINNNKTIDIDYIYKDDESDAYYRFYLYDLLPLNGTK